MADERRASNKETEMIRAAFLVGLTASIATYGLPLLALLPS
jgi:hypothetical protein